MKTQKEIEAKLQDLEALILNLREQIRTSKNPEVERDAYIDLLVTENQAKVIKWVLQ
jgi:hypothetical protein